jgi:hypothetical protein
MSEKNIYGAITQVMLEMDAVAKGRTNVQQGWKFRGIDDLYNALQKIMARFGVFTVPILIKPILKESFTFKNGNTGFHVISEYTFRFYAADASFVDAVAIGEAMDQGDKAYNKAASIAHKYALLAVFCIPTEEDKDPDMVAHDVIIKDTQTPTIAELRTLAEKLRNPEKRQMALATLAATKLDRMALMNRIKQLLDEEAK